MDDFAGLFELYQLIARLKAVERDGWNNRLGGREVANSESVADHTFGMIFSGMVLPLLIPRLNLNRERLMIILAVHDIEEVLTGDINIWVIDDPVERKRLQDEKKRRSHEAMVQIKQDLGPQLGEFVYDAHKEYEDGLTPEAKVAKELDKIEVILQALWYFNHGGKVDPWDFYTNGSAKVTTPELIRFLEEQVKPKLPAL